MRLDFNILLIDDEINDDDENEELLELKKIINQHILDKGFNPNIFIAEDIAQANKTPKNRVDLFISDNNLKGNQNGINYYLDISQDFICDFILYTRSEIESITGEIIAHLQNPKNNPNIFSRFSFTERKKDGVWIDDIKRLIDHVLSRREEINNFRGLYAQLTTQIHHMLQKKFKISYKYSFSETLDMVSKKSIQNNELIKKLHKIRMIRNSLMHNDEEICEKHRQYKIKYTLFRNKEDEQLITNEDSTREKKAKYPKKENLYIYENDIKNFRNEIKELHADVKKICTG